ncbi:MAG TPA: HAD family hydrolase [Anaerolineaceae bacterium]|jgi:putative hydrolase of the HAD superfamily
MFNSLKVILFDLGSTLIYFDGGYTPWLSEATSALARSLIGGGFNLDEAAFISAYDTRIQAYYQERGSEFIEYTTAYYLRQILADFGYPAVPDESIKAALASLYSVSQVRYHLEEDTLSTLNELRQRGYHLGLISNAGDNEDVQTLIDQHGLRSYFEVILVSAEVGIRKPHPRIFQLALDRLGCIAQEAVMVGDTLGADILGAHNAGMPGIWITRRADTPDNRDHLDTIRPDLTVDSLAALLNYL